jgi:hypothetical protein
VEAEVTDYKLYDGEVTLSFLPSKHQYTVDGEKVLSVTGITKVIDKSGPLMWWAVGEALDYVKDNFKPSLDEVEFADMLNDAKYAHAKRSRTATTIGHMAHEWIHEYFAGIEKPMPKNPKLRASIESFLDWADENRVGALADTEFKVYSREFGYAGTCDFDGIVGGERCLVDWKTGKAVYPEMALQTVGYQIAREEELGIQYDARWIVVLPKDGGEIITARYGHETYNLHRNGFLGALDLAKALKEMK